MFACSLTHTPAPKFVFWACPLSRSVGLCSWHALACVLGMPTKADQLVCVVGMPTKADQLWSAHLKMLDFCWIELAVSIETLETPWIHH